MKRAVLLSLALAACGKPGSPVTEAPTMPLPPGPSTPLASAPHASPATGDLPADARARLSRSECFGFCPAYDVEVHGDGTVVYEGKNYVRVKGTQGARIAPDDARALFDHFAHAAFFDMDDEYRVPITDNPTATLTLTLGGRTKTVVDYPPCHGESAARYGLGEKDAEPKELCALEQELDAVTNTAQWTSCADDAGGKTYCRQ